LDEHGRAEERAKAAEAQLIAANFRIQQLLRQIKANGENPDGNIREPTAWNEFAEWCDQHLAGRVVLHPRARREVKDACFGEVAVAASCLLWLANEYRDQRVKGGTGDLRGPIASGLENCRCGDDSFRVDWRGRSAEVEWHIKNGGNTRDPSRCLRIYYFWDDTSQCVVVASMPGHLRTGAT
jgi:hypothetical protein